MLALPSYVFPRAGFDELVQRVTDHLSDYLEDPTGANSRYLSDDLKAQAALHAAAAGVAGLNQSPVFLLRPGSGGPGDEPVEGGAVVIYLNDDPPGVPHVRIYVDELGQAQDWADRVLQPVVFVVDNYADEWSGILTEGQDAHDATAALAGVTWSLLSPTKKVYPLLKTWGFTDPGTRAGAPIRDDIELRSPFTFATEIYYNQS